MAFQVNGWELKDAGFKASSCSIMLCLLDLLREDA